MKRTLYLYLCREIAAPFVLGMATFTLVLLVGRLLKMTEMVVSQGVPLATVLKFVVYLSPTFATITIPMAFLLAVLLAVGRLSADNEVTAMKACGVGLNSLLLPVIGWAVAAAVVTTLVTTHALPWGNSSFKRQLFAVMEQGSVGNLKEKVFNVAFPGVTLYAESLNERTRTMQEVMIQDERKPKEAVTIFAETGQVTTDQAARLIRIHLRNGSIHRLEENDYRLAEFASYDLHINFARLTWELLRDEFDMPIAELRRQIQSGTIPARERRELELELQRRFTVPLSCLVFALVGVPLGMQNRRSGKWGGFALSLVVLIAYYVLMTAGKHLGESGALPTLVAAWLPNGIFLLLGGVLVHSAAQEHEFALVEIVPRLAGRLARRFRRQEESP